jgi:hypothetical protein
MQELHPPPKCSAVAMPLSPQPPSSLDTSATIPAPYLKHGLEIRSHCANPQNLQGERPLRGFPTYSDSGAGKRAGRPHCLLRHLEPEDPTAVQVAFKLRLTRHSQSTPGRHVRAAACYPGCSASYTLQRQSTSRPPRQRLAARRPRCAEVDKRGRGLMSATGRALWRAPARGGGGKCRRNKGGEGGSELGHSALVLLCLFAVAGEERRMSPSHGCLERLPSSHAKERLFLT